MSLTNKILQADIFDGLTYLPSEAIDCAITSPPYWGQRDYQFIGQIGNENHYKEYINNENSFKITLKRRNNDMINRDNFIKVIADKIDNKVNLTNPDIDIRFEFLGNTCGISFLKPDDILKSTYQYE